MFKRFTILCAALTLIALPMNLGCAGRPPAPDPNEEAANYGMGGDSGETTTETSDYGVERQKNDGAQPID